MQRASFRLQNLGLVARLFYSTVAIPESQFPKELILKLNTKINALSDDEEDVMNSILLLVVKPLKAGDVIIHKWYKQFCLEDGNPDLVAITILGDIVAWYRNGTNNHYGELTPKLHGHSLYLSYNYYEQKFGFREDRVRRALTRLYAQNILKRSFKIFMLKGGE